MTCTCSLRILYCPCKYFTLELLQLYFHVNIQFILSLMKRNLKVLDMLELNTNFFQTLKSRISRISWPRYYKWFIVCRMKNESLDVRRIRMRTTKPQKGWERVFVCFKAIKIDEIHEMTYCMLNHIVVFLLMTWPLLFLQKARTDEVLHA